MRRKALLTLTNHRGNTLMEASIGLLILTVILVAIYAGFVTTAKILHEGDEVLQAGQDAFAALETDAGTGGAEESLTLYTDGTGDTLTINLRGSYQMSQDPETGVTLYSFGSKSYQFVAEKMYQDGIQKLQILRDTPKSEWPKEYKPSGYGTNIKNENIRDWVKNYTFGGSWPSLSLDIPTDVMANSDTYCIHIYFDVHERNGRTPSYDVVVYAKTGQGDGWNTSLIYDPDEHVWFQGPGFSVNDQSWTQIKARMAANNWKRIYP